MGLATTVTTTTKEEVKIKPRIKTALTAELKAYAADRLELKAVQERLDDRKAKIGAWREEIGVTSLKLEGFSVTLVPNLRTSLDVKKLIEMGVTTEMIQEATVTKPGKPYEKVTCPGEKDYSNRD